MTLTVVGTSDLHGHIEALPVLAGYLANLRRARAADGGVLLVDAGDLFQGTLESGLAEGAPVVKAYNALGYQAAAIGNHEFDFGPVGEAATPRGPGDDPQGALKARVREARFPFLAANILDSKTKRPIAWENTRPTALVEVAGVKVGLVGVSTEETPHTTISANFAGLEMAPLAQTIADAAAAMRGQGATVIVVAAHEGGKCKKLDDPKDLSSCDSDSKIFQAVRSLPPGAVDVVVAGHTHQAVAQEVAGIAIIQSYATGRAFGRVDLAVGADGRVSARTIHPPRDLCSAKKADAPCEPGDYEGAPVVADAALEKLLAPDVERARARREQKVGVTVTETVARSFDKESPLGNLTADLMRVARKADVALTNGGGLRAELPAGELTYGQLYEAWPFDNRFATLRITGADLATMIRRNLERSSGIFALSGVRAKASCDHGVLAVTLVRDDGRPIAPTEPLVLVTSDFLATGGDDLTAGLHLAEGAVTIEDGAPMREALVDVLRTRGGTLSGTSPRMFDASRRRLEYDGSRPLTCAAK